LSYFDQYKEKTLQLKTDVVVGIDPHTHHLPSFLEAELNKLAPLDYLERFCRVHIEASASRVAAVKFQVAFFEAFGVAGISALIDAVGLAKAKGLLTIVDAKRGDISTTMQAYARATFDQINGDCMTVVPYMGLDVLEALMPWLSKGKGIYVVWVTSNEGARLPQYLQLSEAQKQKTVAEALYQEINQWRHRHGLNDVVGYVCGAGHLDGLVGEGDPLALTNQHLLVPGFGAQKAKAGVGLKRLRSSVNQGSLAIAMSRAVSFGPDRASCRVESWQQYLEFVSSNLTNILKSS